MNVDKQLVWVVITDSALCKIYDYSKKPAALTLVKEFNHPENRLRDIELTSGKPGHFQSGTGGHGAFSQATDPKEVKIDAFSREIAHALDKARTSRAYTHLIIIAGPHMHGLLIQNMNKQIKNLVSHHIEKDVMHLSDQQLLNLIKVEI